MWTLFWIWQLTMVKIKYLFSKVHSGMFRAMPHLKGINKCKNLWILQYNYSSIYFHSSVQSGRCGSAGKSSHLAVGGLLIQSQPGRVEVSLSKTPNPQLLLRSWLVPCMAANRCCWGINCTALWIKALYKCSPFTIFHLFLYDFKI